MKTILLAGPGKNALSTDLIARTLAAVREAGDAPLLLTGEGDAFSAGLNLKEVVTFDEAAIRRYLRAFEDLVQALYEHPGPVVAWINGHAIAGGCVLALAADLLVMTAREGARIGLNEVALGVRFPPRAFEMLRRRLTSPVLDRLVLESAVHSAHVAYRLGFVDVVGEEADALARLEKLATFPRAAYAAAKQSLRGSLQVSDAVQRRFDEEAAPCWVTPELKAHLRAALEKKATS